MLAINFLRVCKLLFHGAWCSGCFGIRPSMPAFSLGLLSSAMCTQAHDNGKCQFRVLKIRSVCVKIKLSIVDYFWNKMRVRERDDASWARLGFWIAAVRIRLHLLAIWRKQSKPHDWGPIVMLITWDSPRCHTTLSGFLCQMKWNQCDLSIAGNSETDHEKNCTITPQNVKTSSHTFSALKW